MLCFVSLLSFQITLFCFHIAQFCDNISICVFACLVCLYVFYIYSREWVPLIYPTKDVVVHYNGSWSRPSSRKVGWEITDYVGGEEIKLEYVNGDELSMIMLKNMIVEKTPTIDGNPLIIKHDPLAE